MSGSMKAKIGSVSLKEHHMSSLLMVNFQWKGTSGVDGSAGSVASSPPRGLLVFGGKLGHVF